MRLENILQNFPNIALASSENNEEILDFFGRFLLKNNDDQVLYHREPNFFSLLKGRGNHLLFTLRKDNGDLQGIASVTYRKGYVEGKETIVGYLGDLRVTLNRSLIRQWRNCFKSFIENSHLLEETKGCCYYQTALMDDNGQSKANLASNKILGVHYNLVASYNMVNVVGRWKKRTEWKGYKVFPLSLLSKEEHSVVFKKLNDNEKKLPFGHVWPYELEHRKKYWPGFSEENILVLKSKTGEIVGATCYYDPSELKKMSLTSIPSILKLTKVVSKLIPFYQQSDLPKVKEELIVLYLENAALETNSETLINLSLHYLFDKKKFHMIALTEWKNQPFENCLRGMTFHKTPMGLYSVHPQDSNGDPLYTETLSLENYSESSFPRFDMAMV